MCEYGLGDRLVLELAKGPLIYDRRVTRVLKQTGSDPGLRTLLHRSKEKMGMAKTSSTSQPPRLTPRTMSEPYGKPGLTPRDGIIVNIETKASVHRNERTMATPYSRRNVTGLWRGFLLAGAFKDEALVFGSTLVFGPNVGKAWNSFFESGICVCPASCEA